MKTPQQIRNEVEKEIENIKIKMETKTWQEGTKKAKCKNCGKDIYLAKCHDCWYHCNDDRDICRAREKVDSNNFNHLFDKAEPELNYSGLF